MRKLKIISYFVSIFIVIYLLFGFALLPIILKNQLIKNLDEKLTLKSQIEKIEFNPLTFEFTLNNYKLLNKNSENNTLSLKKLYVDMAFFKSLFNYELNIQNIIFDELVLNIKEEENGFDIENILKKDDKKENSNSIKFLLSQISLSNSSINITNIKNYTIYLKEINLDIRNLGNSKQNISSTDNLTFKINDNSNIQISGSSKIEPFEIDGKIILKDLKIKDLTDFKKELLNFSINQESNINSIINYSIENSKKLNLKLSSEEFEVSNLSIKQNNIFTSFKKLIINKFDFVLDNFSFNFDNAIIKSLNFNFLENNLKINAKNTNLQIKDFIFKKNTYRIGKIEITNPSIYVLIPKKSSLNKKENILINKQKTDEDQKIKFEITSVNLQNGTLNFEDKNLPISFKTIVSKLNGNISQINDQNSTTSNLKIDGIVDNYGIANITGIINPNNVKFLTDINLIFKNIALKNFTPYSGKFLGRELKSGKLDLDLKYNIDKSNLDAKNNITITKLELGKNIKSKDAVSLPLEIAISLLEDENNIINIDIPISGNVDEPQFSVGSIVWKAFSNLILKSVTAPFSLIAKAFNFDEKEISNIKFNLNEEKITPIQKESLDKIAQILNAKRSFIIEIYPSYKKEMEKEKIALERAFNIKNYLIKNKSVNKNQIILNDNIKNSNSSISINIKMKQ
jgi:hypothetical protein